MKVETLIVATGNKHKLQEIQAIFKDVRVVSAREAGYLGDPEETGATFEENAIIKARAAAEALNLPALADDSGLCVAALGGAPGIYSARYAGGHGDDKKNREKTACRTRRREKPRGVFSFGGGAVLSAKHGRKNGYGNGRYARQNFNARRGRKRVRLRLSVLQRRFMQELRRSERGGEKRGFAPLPRVDGVERKAEKRG